MKKIIVFLSIVIFIFPLIIRAEEITLSLDEALIIGLRDNRDVLLKTEDIKKAKLKIAESKAGLMPSVSFTGGWADTRGYYSKDTGQTAAQATLKQYVYKGGRTVNTIKFNEYGLSVAEAVLDRTRLELMLNIKKAFYTLIFAQDLKDLNKKILDNTREHADSLRSRYDKGQASESDMLRAQSYISNVQQAYEASVNQGEAGAALLRNLLHLGESIVVHPEGALTYQPQEFAYDEAFVKALKSRPEIRQYEAQQKAGEKAIEIAKADSRPSIYASWDYYSRSNTAAGTAKNWNDYNVIGATISWPIFDGWATRAKAEQAIIDLKETGILKEKTTADIAFELKNAYLDLKTALTWIKSIQDQTSVYMDNLSVIRAKFSAGISSFLDMQDAMLAYDVAVFNEKQVIYDYLVAKARFDKAMGD